MIDLFTSAFDVVAVNLGMSTAQDINRQALTKKNLIVRI